MSSRDLVFYSKFYERFLTWKMASVLPFSLMTFFIIVLDVGFTSFIVFFVKERWREVKTSNRFSCERTLCRGKLRMCKLIDCVETDNGNKWWLVAEFLSISMCSELITFVGFYFCSCALGGLNGPNTSYQSTSEYHWNCYTLYEITS